VGWLYAVATVYFGSKLLNRWDAWRLRKRLQKERYGTAGADGTQAAPLDSLEPDVPLITSG
jgi:hypothetical protein